MSQIVIPPDIRAQAAIAKRKKLLALESLSGYRAQHQAKYWNDPAGWARNCIDWFPGETLADYQADVMSALPTRKRVSARATHGSGKSTLAALIILWFADTRDGKDWKLPTTASAWRQLEKYLWPEVHKWVRRIRWDVVGRQPYKEDKELLDKSIKLSTGEAFAVASDNADLIEGAHADHLLYVFDESKAIPAETWDAAEGAFASGNCMWLSISTPGDPNGRFYDIQSRRPGYEDWWVRHITLKECVTAGRVSQEWADNRKKQWGAKSPVYLNRVEGEFASSDEDTVISLDVVERSNERWLARKDLENQGQDPWGLVTGIGADIGRGGDPSVINLQCGNAVKEFRKIQVIDTMHIAGLVKGLLELHKKAKAVIDVIGIGAGVVDRCREFKEIAPRVIAFNAAEHTDMLDESEELGFANKRSAGWWAVREGLIGNRIDLPPDDELIGELVSPKWKVQSGGKILVESKDEIKKRIGRSTNYADTVIQVFMPEEKKKVAGTFGRSK